MNIKMSKDELKEMVDNVCHLVMNVSWGKQIVSEWNGDSLFVYADPNAYEPEWDSLDCDLDDIGSFVMSMTGLNYAGDTDKHLIAICWHDPISSLTTSSATKSARTCWTTARISTISIRRN